MFCQYRRFEGVATIAAIEAPGPETPTGCVEDPRVVTFDFEPSDADAYGCYGQPDLPDTGQHLAILSRACIESAGLDVGDTHPSARSDIRPGSGTCSPVIFDHSLLDLSSCTPPPSVCAD